jgi:hypothetical protein
LSTTIRWAWAAWAVAGLCTLSLGGRPANTQDQSTAGNLKAFPEAEGFGALATGGRSGEVYHVTTIKDDGPGSLRQGVAMTGRTIVFDVGGYIELASPLQIASDITIAGQTAPGDGIGIKGHGVSLADSANVIIRYLRIRQGKADGEEKVSALDLSRAKNIILDHISIQFGRAACLNLTESRDITVQNCILGPGIAPGRLGCVGDGENITFARNLWIDNQAASPRLQGKIQFVNNVLYNWKDAGFEFAPTTAGGWYDLSGNYFIRGPVSGSQQPISAGDANTHVYATDNWSDITLDSKLNGAALTKSDLGPVKSEKKAFANPAIAVTIDTAKAGFRKVLLDAGCSLRRDAVDTFLIGDLASLGGRGKLIASPDDIGGFGELKGGKGPKDTDRDGIPDDWEKSHGLDPKDPKDATKLHATGYTNLERYVNSLARTKLPDSLFAVTVNPLNLLVKPGSKSKLTVTAARKGWDGLITVDLRNLPAHMTAAQASIPQGTNSVDIDVNADKAAKSSRADVYALGTGYDADITANSPNFTVGVPAGTFALSVTPATLKLKAGGKGQVQVHVKRQDFTGPIQVTLGNLQPGVTAGKATIAAGKNVADLEVSAAKNAPAGEWAGVVAQGMSDSFSGTSPPFRIVITKK